MRIRAMVVAVSVALGAPSALRAEPLPGLLDPAEVDAARREAVAQKRDARAAIRRNARLLGYSREQIALALTPTMKREGTFVHRLDDGTEIEFPWFRTGFAENRLANTARPIARDASGAPVRKETNKGGLRIHKGVFGEEVEALSLKMDSKLATAGDAFGGENVRGAKGGIGAGRVIKVGSRYQAKVGDFVDPASPVIDRPQLMRRFAGSYRASGGDVGPGLDIQAGDLNTKAPEMKALAETYGSPERPSSGVSGKAVRRRRDGTIDPSGGIEYRGVSTGEGVWMSARLAARRAGLKLRGATVVAQGWGEVGRAFGMAAVKDGARVIAIQNLWKVDGKQVAGVLFHPLGDKARPAQVRAWLRDVDALIASGQDIGAFEGGRLAANFQAGADTADLRADIVGLNALGNVLTEKTVPRYIRSGTHSGQRKIIAEGANLAETAGGARRIDAARKKLLVVTGDLANLGGVHVSNLEGVQNLARREVSSEVARRSLQRTMRSGWERAMKIADQRGLSERAAIELAAVDAMMKRSLQLPDAPRNDLERRVLSRTRTRTVARRPLAPRARTNSRSAMLRQLGTASSAKGVRSGRPARKASVGAHSRRTPARRTAVRAPR